VKNPTSIRSTMRLFGRASVPSVVASALAVAAVVVWLPQQASAAPLSAEAGCRDASSKAARKAAALTVNIRAKCVRQRMRGRIAASVDCAADPPALGGSGTGDPLTDAQLGRVVRYRDQQVSRLASKCKTVDLVATGIASACTPSATSIPALTDCIVLTRGKEVGDALFALIDVPRQAVIPGSGARRCYEVINRALRNTERSDVADRAKCFKEAARTGQAFDCLATVAPPGVVSATGYQPADEGLLKRYSQFQGNIFNFCTTPIEFDSIGFADIQSDPTPAPLTLDDVIGNLYDGVLQAASTITGAVFVGARCGDGQVDAGEQCDDGNRESCDGCDRDCTLPACGNGAGCTPELCDDGNLTGGDGCDGSCVSEICGNGVTQPGEQCDDGVGNSDVLPDACRSDCKLPSCGDGVIDAGEACEPPGVGDCEPDCTSPNCGDGILDPGEQCDNGPANSNTTPDACRLNCHSPSCGDSVVDPSLNEQCDPPDGGLTCKADCRFVTCGNGLPDPGEECDDGASNSDTTPDACRTNCTAPACGDNVVDSGETCDPGAQTASCDGDCTAVQCGDGWTNGAAGELCDDSNLTDGDGCDSNCTPTGCGNGIVTAGEFCDTGGESASCDDDCTAPVCGDGNANAAAGEDCDTSGESATCDADCTSVVCGDGIINTAAGEECEDGNATGGDGCSAACTCGPGSGEAGCQDPKCPNRGELIIYAAVRETPCATNTDCEVDGALVGQCDTGLGQCVTATDLDTGWTGFAHNSDIDDGLVTRGILSCPGPFDGGLAEPCGDCTVAGLDTSFGDLCRCNNDNQAICTNGFALDPASCSTGVSCSTNADCKRCSVNTGTGCNLDSDCPLGGSGGEICLNGNRQPTCSSGQCVGTCNCYFGPPLPLSSGSTPACVLNRFANDISGTANVDLGSGEITANLKAIVFLGELVTVPCPYCTGDTTPRDGNRDGTCVLGDNNGDACDVQSANLTFPSPAGDGYSLDCFPAIGKNVSGTGLVIDLVQTTSSDSLTAAVPCGLSFAKLCQCARCANDIQQTCTTNGDCATCTTNADCGGATGTCDGSHCRCRGSGVLNPQPNQCSNGNCIDSGDGVNGACETGPDDQYCDGAFRANGEPFVTCVSNADCDNTDCGSGVGPGLCGTCSLMRRRQCFLDTINVIGSADPQTPVGAALFCAAETSNPGINSVAGLPGPGRVVNQARAKTFCASNPAVEYVPGVGGCP